MLPGASRQRYTDQHCRRLKSVIGWFEIRYNSNRATDHWEERGELGKIWILLGQLGLSIFHQFENLSLVLTRYDRTNF